MTYQDVSRRIKTSQGRMSGRVQACSGVFRRVQASQGVMAYQGVLRRIKTYRDVSWRISGPIKAQQDDSTRVKE